MEKWARVDILKSYQDCHRNLIMSQSAQIINLSSGGPTGESHENPEQSAISKFVIFSFDDRLIFVYGSVKEFSYHAGLVKRFCDISGIPSGWIRKPDLYGIYADSYRLRGGGWMEEKPGQKHLRFYGYSTAYGPFDPEDIVYLFENHENVSGYQITIDE